MRSLIPDEWFEQGLQPKLYERLGQSAGAQRAIVPRIETLEVDENGIPIDQQWLLVVREVPRFEQARQERTVLVWGRNDVWKYTGGGKPYRDDRDGRKAMNHFLERYEKEIERLSSEMGQARTAKQFRRILRQMVRQSHAANNVYEALQAAREEIQQTYRKDDTTLIDLRNKSYGIQRDYELLKDDIENAMAYREANQAEWLNLLLSIFFPLTIIGAFADIGLLEQFWEFLAQYNLDPTITLIILVIGFVFIGAGGNIIFDNITSEKASR